MYAVLFTLRASCDVLQINLSTRPEKYVGSDDIWQKAEASLVEALELKVGQGIFTPRSAKQAKHMFLCAALLPGP